MDRTQIYLSEGQKAELAALSAQTGESQSALIRGAIDKMIAENNAEKSAGQKEFLQKYAGAWADDPDLTQERFEAIRATADSRVKGLWGGLSDNDQEDYKG